MAAFDDVFKTIQGWLKIAIELGASLILVFLVLDILFASDFVIGNINTIVENLAEDGVAGLIALLLLLLLFKR